MARLQVSEIYDTDSYIHKRIIQMHKTFNNEYKYRDGILYRKKIGKGIKTGICGTKDSGGYIAIKLNGKIWKAHRIIYQMFNPEWDITNVCENTNVIDHINGNRADNRIENLRVTTKQGNQWNQTKAKGYSFCKTHKKWLAYIAVNDTMINLGYYNTEEKAKEARRLGKIKYHNRALLI